MALWHNLNINQQKASWNVRTLHTMTQPRKHIPSSCTLLHTCSAEAQPTAILLHDAHR